MMSTNALYSTRMCYAGRGGYHAGVRSYLIYIQNWVRTLRIVTI
jgi:hypothetical protein